MGRGYDSAFVSVDEALVGLELEMDVYNVENEQHAERIMITKVGQRATNIPLTILDVEVIEDDDGPEDGINETVSPEMDEPGDIGSGNDASDD